MVMVTFENFTCVCSRDLGQCILWFIYGVGQPYWCTEKAKPPARQTLSTCRSTPQKFHSKKIFKKPSTSYFATIDRKPWIKYMFSIPKGKIVNINITMHLQINQLISSCGSSPPPTSWWADVFLNVALQKKVPIMFDKGQKMLVVFKTKASCTYFIV